MVWGLPKMSTGKDEGRASVKKAKATAKPKAKPKEKVTGAKDGKTKCGKEKDAPDIKGKGEPASAAMQSHIEEVRIIKAKGRTYITGVFGEPRKRTLVVEISDRMSCNHVKLIETIAE